MENSATRQDALRQPPLRTTIAPESQLLVDLCRMQLPQGPASGFSPDLSQPIRWDRFLHVLEWHRVAGIVHRSLRALPRSSVPPHVAAFVAGSAAIYAARANEANARTAQIVTALDAESVPSAVLKGVPLSLQIFGDMGIRDSRDIDLLVPRADAMRADRLLTELGYRRIYPDPNEDSRFLSEFFARRVHFEYNHPVSGQQVELHWRLWESAELGPRESDPAIWETYRVPGMTARVLPHELLLPYLCVHGAKHAWFRMKWLLDVACLLEMEPDAGDRLLHTAAVWGSTIPAVQALQLSHRWFGTAVPLAAKHPSLYARTVISIAEGAMTAGGLAETPRQEYIASKRPQLARLLLSSRPRYLLRESWEWLVDLAGWERYSNPQRAVRLLLWVPRWAARRIGMLRSS